MAEQGTWAQVVGTLKRVVAAATRPNHAPLPGRETSAPPADAAPGGSVDTYPGDVVGWVVPEYDPHPDGRPDPGEIVWTWVPYEEDHSRGKDRPVLLIGRDAEWLLGLPLTSQDHDRDAAQEARAGRHWVDIGSGPWDSQGRPSEVRVDRVVRVDARRLRREGAVLGRDRFEEVAAAVRALRS